ncbi:hypothetical protein [Arundinibacter roseus]|uniref:Uncharacterized protein n=1 Tax=Arundinibacter roseus TaxID=2070510 RepID=A0A4R4KDW9_9BACT|nr:hypothetical protein [Arundinibacter roseus]TDB64609.1 hypothetical protein EZE20_13135 [Arundinibacter roseus]
MKTKHYIQLLVTDEQKAYARQLVEHSLAHHQVANVWDRAADKRNQTRLLRFTGTLGEIVFADLYALPRPIRSFGAVNGQDWGQDFILKTGTHSFSLDIKSMKRMTGILNEDYVLNIPASQLHKPNSRTTHYFCLSFHQSKTHQTIVSLLGFIDKNEVESKQIGNFYSAGTQRTRRDGTVFTFQENTYEISFKDIHPLIPTDRIRAMEGFRLCQLRRPPLEIR